MQVRWTSPAAKDLEEIVLYIQRDSADSAKIVAKTLFDAANSLEFMPSRGRAGRIMGTRELMIPGLPYFIVYEVMDTAVQIHHIYHAARNWTGEL
jgi:addiction module RelE/StbE family toxin